MEATYIRLAVEKVIINNLKYKFYGIKSNGNNGL